MMAVWSEAEIDRLVAILKITVAAEYSKQPASARAA